MAGLVPAIHAETLRNKENAPTMSPTPLTYAQPRGVDARDKRGHDEPLAPALDNIEVRSK
jgi:hypothetical protein